jgi:hypothetical protein
MTTETDYAWLAGIVDGEGSIMISRTRVQENHLGFSYRGAISISNTSEEMMKHILKIAGVGNLTRLPESRFDWKDRFNYHASAGAAQILLPKIMPYLILKKPQAEVLTEFLGLIGGQGRKVAYDGRIDFLYQKMRALNMKGKQSKLESYIAHASRPWIQD